MKEFLFVLGGSVITYLVQWILSRRKQKAEIDSIEIKNIKELLEIYQTTICDLRGEICQLRKEVETLRILNTKLLKELHQLKKNNEQN
jgi:predicted RNase H-like nuclease (RuvC/YqgF family)